LEARHNRRIFFLVADDVSPKRQAYRHAKFVRWDGLAEVGGMAERVLEEPADWRRQAKPGSARIGSVPDGLCPRRWPDSH
jgi:hypothetical protein